MKFAYIQIVTFEVVAWAEVEVVAVFPLPRDLRRRIASCFACQLERFVLPDANFARCPFIDYVRRFGDVKESHLYTTMRHDFNIDKLSILKLYTE